VKILLGAQFNALSSYVQHAFFYCSKSNYTATNYYHGLGAPQLFHYFVRQRQLETRVATTFVVAVVVVVNHFEMSIIKV
jgi:hypothetical protein